MNRLFITLSSLSITLFSSFLFAQVSLNDNTLTQISLSQQECVRNAELDNPIQWILDGDLSNNYRTAIRLYAGQDIQSASGEPACWDYQAAIQNSPEPLGLSVKDFQETADESIGQLQPYLLTNTPSVFFSELDDSAFSPKCGDGVDEQLLACLYVTDQTDLNLTNSQSFALVITIDTEAPPVPEFESINSTGSGFTVTVDSHDQDDDIHALIMECDTNSTTDAGTTDDTNTNHEDNIYDLEFPTFPSSDCNSPGPSQFYAFENTTELVFRDLNDSDYIIALWRIDNFGNVSDASDTMTARPTSGTSYLELLDEGNVKESSISCDGCDCGSAEAAFLLPALLLFRRRKRKTFQRQHLLMSVLFLGLFVQGQSLHAEAGQKSFSFLVGPYLPALDESQGSPMIGDQGLYECLFHNQNMFSVGLRGGYQFWHNPNIGSIEGQFGLSFAQTSFMALEPQHRALPEGWNLNEGCPSDRQREDVGEELAVTVTTLSPGLAFTVDPILDRLRIPFVPFVRVAFDAANYAFTRDGAYDQASLSHKPAGLLFGYTTAAGLHFSLDWLKNPGGYDHKNNEIIRRFGEDQYGLEHLYITAEWVQTRITNFSDDGFNFSRHYRTDNNSYPWSFNIGLTAELW